MNDDVEEVYINPISNEVQRSSICPAQSQGPGPQFFFANPIAQLYHRHQPPSPTPRCKQTFIFQALLQSFDIGIIMASSKWPCRFIEMFHGNEDSSEFEEKYGTSNLSESNLNFRNLEYLLVLVHFVAFLMGLGEGPIYLHCTKMA